jgi:hypothetical protein
MVKTFPAYSNHDAVACFNCTQTLAASEPQESGFAPRHGEYKKECPRCGMKTWYDVKGGAR